MNTNKPTVDFDYFDTEAEVNGSIKLPLETGRKILDLLLDAAKPSSLGQIKPKSEIYFVAPTYGFPTLTPQELAAVMKAPTLEQIIQQDMEIKAQEFVKKRDVDHKHSILNTLTSIFCECNLCKFYKVNGFSEGGFTGKRKMGVAAGVSDGSQSEWKAEPPTAGFRVGEFFVEKNKASNSQIDGEPIEQAMAKMSAEADQDVLLPRTEPVVSKSHNMSANNPLIIMFNAPPQSGKDTCADAVMSAFKGVRKVNFKDSLYKRSAAILGYDLSFWTSICQNNEMKDKPMKDIKIGTQLIRNATPRDMLIAVAEKVIKPEFGNNIFAVDALNSIRQHMSNNIGGNIFVIPDCGFDYEADVIKGAFPNAKVVVVQIEREGHTFDNDSRDWVPCDHILYNRGLEALQKDVLSLVANLLIELNVKTMAVK